jgi:hypothetical protein
MRCLIYALLVLALPLSGYAEDQVRKNDPKAVDQYIEQLNTDVPKDLVRSIAWCESQWRQYRDNGLPFIDGSMSRVSGKYSKDYGIMQINEKTIDAYGWRPKLHRIQYDWRYNIRLGVRIFRDKLVFARHLRERDDWDEICERYNLENLTDTEIAIICYNGLQADHVYLRYIKGISKKKPWEKIVGSRRRVSKDVSKTHHIR